MYLGVHSPADITGGMVIGAIILRIFLSISESIDNWILTGHNVPMIVITTTFFLLSIHPQTTPATYTFAETATVLGWISGNLLGSWFKCPDQTRFVIFPPDAFIGEEAQTIIGTCLILITYLWKPVFRFLLGLLLIAITYFVVKKLTSFFLQTMGLIKIQNQATKTKPSRDLTISEALVKLLTYGSMGFMTSAGVPIVFDSLNLW